MSEPEIARRCTHCGVTLRQNAMFCPQCGQEIDGDNAARTVDLSVSTVAETPTPPAVPPANDVHDSTGVAGNVRQRVEEIRHVSSVVIDQAAYDPSLRFILIAAMIFILFLVLLIMSKLID